MGQPGRRALHAAADQTLTAAVIAEVEAEVRAVEKQGAGEGEQVDGHESGQAAMIAAWNCD